MVNKYIKNADYYETLDEVDDDWALPGKERVFIEDVATLKFGTKLGGRAEQLF